jgi:hypothetical protein
MRKCEDRLRRLHPYAMARYDRLRGDGVSPLDALRETAPLFGRSPHARPGDSAPFRHALGVGAGTDVTQSADRPLAAQAEPLPADVGDDRAEQRGRQIVERLQASARATGRPDLGPDELAMILEAVTNLPEDMIGTLTRNASDESQPGREELGAAAAIPAADIDAPTALAATATAAARPAGASVARSAAQLAAESFPHAAADALRAASTPRPRNPVRTPARIHRPDRAKPPGPSM